MQHAALNTISSMSLSGLDVLPAGMPPLGVPIFSCVTLQSWSRGIDVARHGFFARILVVVELL